MSLAQRLMAAAVVLALSAGASWLINRHLEEGKEGQFATPRASLASLPLSLTSPAGAAPGGVTAAAPFPLTWEGKEHPNRKAIVEQVPFANDVLYRIYATAPDCGVVVYAAYSALGEDRKHHPEICMREAAGIPEDIGARLEVPLDGKPPEDSRRWAQRYRFRASPGRSLHLYYWHYTLPTVDRPGETSLQALHRRLVASPPSITVQVNAYAEGDGLLAVERSLLPALDKAFRDTVLPEGTVTGHTRIPVSFLRR